MLHTDDSLDTPVDLTNCDREPIHILGTVQPFGFLLGVDGDGRVRRASANLARFAPFPPDVALGADIADLIEPGALAALRERIPLLRGGDAVERLFALSLFEGGPAFDVAVHFSNGEWVIEAEPATDGAAEAGNLIRAFTGRLRQAETMPAFLREAARQVKAMTGFDRVMVYRFDETGSGEVVAEALSAGVDSFHGLHYPASDIPAQARALYLRNIFRVIADIGAEPVPLLSAGDAPGVALDQSLCLLRAVSPIHIEYLRNMGVGASLSISIVVEGQLWGLFACHHHAPRLPGLAMRTTAELFGQLFSFMLESRLRSETSDYELRARRASDRIMATVAQNPALMQDPDWLGDVIFELIPADGVAVFLDGQTALSGLTPTPAQCTAILDFLNAGPAREVMATDSIQTLLPAAAAHADTAAGMLAIPLSRAPRNHVVLFRAEQLRTVRWAGNPEKSVEHGPNGDRLTPRKSFEAWTRLVQGTSLPFTRAERQVAETLRNGMLEVLLRLAEDATQERERAHERQEVLIAELNHRVRNILSLIRGLISQTERSSETIEDFVANLDGRVQSLARAHDQVTHDHWGPASLIELLNVEASAYLDERREALLMKGPDVLLQPVAFTALALVFHELMTNAAKYGALSGDGMVLISWRLDAEGDLVLDWVESGGPPVAPPTRRGFGSVIIETSIPHDLGGQADAEYRLHGFAGHFRIPARHVVGTGGTVAAERARAHVPLVDHAPLSGLKVLLAEDNMIIALDAEQHLFDLGAADVLVAASAEEALAMIEADTPDFAALDYNLGDATSVPVAERLRALGVPFAFMTGLGDTLVVEGLEDTPLVQKPYGASQIAAAAARALAGKPKE
ncbi:MULTISPECIES: HWE histidine kinase domain-containing protein [Novosphingobium]|uniref:HWE histidine kinase domain-containing protein n=1 Tax=Novosphingobium TaxID=165696 RepID=UPI001CD6194D|nr:HWE histidine kinase domain-containing protein [Novosphingobium percolationis]